MGGAVDSQEIKKQFFPFSNACYEIKNFKSLNVARISLLISLSIHQENIVANITVFLAQYKIFLKFSNMPMLKLVSEISDIVVFLEEFIEVPAGCLKDIDPDTCQSQ